MILVTGGTGLVGSHLLCELTQRNELIRACYRTEIKKEETRKLFEFYFQEKAQQFFSKIEWVKADILSIPSLNDLFVGVSYVYHCAALVSFHKIDFYTCLKVNRQGTANIVNMCLSYNVKKLCYVSSTAALGYNANGLTDETTTWKPGKEVSGYSISKYSAEKEVWRGIEEGLSAVIINPSLILGPGNWKESSLSIFKTASKGILFYPTGSNAIVDVRDVVFNMIFLMQSANVNKKYLCIGQNISFQTLLSTLAQCFKKRPPIFKTPRFISLLFATFSETINLFLRKRRGLTIESAYSAYKNIRYDNSLIIATTGHAFTPIIETLNHAIKGRIQ
jgi:nucleoside-diphosphate-sugar epimerase